MESAPVRLRSRQEGSISTTRVRKRSGVIEEEVSNTDKVPIPEDLKNPGYVMVKGSITKNMGDFNSVGVSVSISMPCRAVLEEIEKTYKTCTETVDRLLENELRKATGEVEGATDTPASII